MDVLAIMGLVMKGVSVIQTLVEVGKDVAPAVKVVTDLISGAKSGTLTEADLTATEATLDGMIDDFNEPM